MIRNSGNSISSCSASAINSEGKNMVLTAAHCNYNSATGWNIGYDRSWIFVPGYQNGNAPYGQWEAKLLITTNEWFNNGDYNNDVGLALVHPLNGRSLVNAVGALGVTWGQPELGQFTVQGYPAESPFNGSGQYFCTGSSSHWGTNQISMPCNMTRGVSGSPWLRGYDTSSGYANGVASTIDRIVNPTIITSPYFSSQNIGKIYNEHRYG